MDSKMYFWAVYITHGISFPFFNREAIGCDLIARRENASAVECGSFRVAIRIKRLHRLDGNSWYLDLAKRLRLKQYPIAILCEQQTDIFGPVGCDDQVSRRIAYRFHLARCLRKNALTSEKAERPCETQTNEKLCFHIELV